MAPEMLQDQPYDYGIDVWSFGVLLYNLLSNNKEPFLPGSDATFRELLDSTMKTKLTFDGPEWSGVSDICKDLISEMLKQDPKRRPNMGS